MALEQTKGTGGADHRFEERMRLAPCLRAFSSVTSVGVRGGHLFLLTGGSGTATTWPKCSLLDGVFHSVKPGCCA